MFAPSLPQSATWLIAALAISGVIIRPWRVLEAAWAAAGALALVASGLLPWRKAVFAVGEGTDVYLFLTGMMLLSELARREGLFDFVAALAVRRAKGSQRRLFLLAYGIGTLVTVFMSNDATAAVLTPAVYAAPKLSGFGQPRRSAVETAFRKIADRISTLIDDNQLLRYVVGHDHAWSATFSWAARLSEISGCCRSPTADQKRS